MGCADRGVCDEAYVSTCYLPAGGNMWRLTEEVEVAGGLDRPVDPYQARVSGQLSEQRWLSK